MEHHRFFVLTLNPHPLHSNLTFKLKHGQTGVSIVLSWFICALAKPLLHHTPGSGNRVLLLRSFIQHKDRAIEQQLSGRIILGVSPLISLIGVAHTVFSFFSVFQHIPPQYCATLELLLPSRGF
ncbi:hypothetical protein ACN42_g7697 [Penicillium freii]|uniref:Uncharacterized protein n=1 Tax=Penicillium freii TaxID=48697 RepID=A0A101MF29_PENFR|nr:hypothetical protein ACN42_g7697 [Penicillium freii]